VPDNGKRNEERKEERKDENKNMHSYVKVKLSLCFFKLSTTSLRRTGE
jgi:hypothetical protein